MTEPPAPGRTPSSDVTPASTPPSGVPLPSDALPLLLTLGLAGLAYLLTRGTGGTLGLNVPLIVAALLGPLLVVLKRRGPPVQRPALVLLGLGSLCTLGLAVHDGALITGLNLLGLFAALGLGLTRLRVPGLTRLGVGQVLIDLLWSGLRGLYGVMVSALCFPWARLRLHGLTRRLQTERTRRVLTGVGLSVPLLLIFGALLVGADAGFGTLIARLFRWQLPSWETGELIFALFQLTFWTFLLGSPVYTVLLARRPAPQIGATTPPALGLTELGLPLLSTSALFCVFLAVQSGRFFGPRLPDHLTYSQAAWQGFGALTAVAALTLAVLLAAHTLLRRELRHTLAYRLISAAVLLPLTLLIVSAYGRLSLYVQAYGLSEIRVLGGVFLAWVVLSLLAYTVLLWRNGLERFAYFSLISGLGLIVGLNGVNPGRLIATVNLSRALDATQYAGGGAGGDTRRSGDVPVPVLVETARLGPDALPALLGPLNRSGGLSGALNDPGFGPALTCALARQDGGGAADWRTWNLARRRATALIRALKAAHPAAPWANCAAPEPD